MAGVLIESLHGTGAIHAAGQFLRMVDYDLSVWSTGGSEGGTTGEAEPRVDGHINLTGAGEAVVLAGADSLVLTLQDGRRLTFQLTSSAGEIARGRWLP